MVQLKPTSNGVQVLTDAGTYIGTARHSGKPLTSAAALAQLGFAENEDGTLRALTPEERLAGLGLGPVAPEAPQAGTTASEPALTPAQKAARTRAARKANAA